MQLGLKALIAVAAAGLLLCLGYIFVQSIKDQKKSNKIPDTQHTAQSGTPQADPGTDVSPAVTDPAEPTASAVVSDVIDAAKHPNVNIPILWAEEKLELGCRDDMVNAFFARVPAEEKAKAEAALSIARTVELAEHPEEFAFVTEPMTEGEFARRAAELTVIHMVRVEVK